MSLEGGNNFHFCHVDVYKIYSKRVVVLGQRLREFETPWNISYGTYYLTSVRISSAIFMFGWQGCPLSTLNYTDLLVTSPCSAIIYMFSKICNMLCIFIYHFVFCKCSQVFILLFNGKGNQTTPLKEFWSEIKY